MFRFEHIEYLWLLSALLPFIALFVWYMWWRKNAMLKFASSGLMSELAKDASSSKQILKFVLLSLAFVFVVLGFANPQIGTKQEKVKREGIDVIIALDVSNSMLAEDIKPNRLMRAKNFIGNFIDELHNDRLGMIVFAGRAYLQMPLTVDYSAGRMYLKSINTNMVPTQGTAIGEAVNLARQSFAKGDNKSKALIILSDGEDNEDGAESAIEDAAKEGIKVFTIGVGSANGGPIPYGTDFKRDNENNIVLTKLNQAMLKDLAGKGKGKFFMLGSGKEEIGAIFKELGRIQTKEFEEMVFTDFDDQFQWCLAIAVLLLMVEWWISERKFSFKF